MAEKNRFKLAREMAGNNSLEYVAEDSGISKNTIWKLERGLVDAGYKVVGRLAEYYHVNVAWLMGQPNTSPSLDETDQAITKATGLSESSIRNICKYKNIPDMMLCINQFISSDEFINAVSSIVISKKTPITIKTTEQRKETIEQGSELINIILGKEMPKDLKVSLDGNELKEWQKWNASQSLSNLIDRLVKGDIDNGTR